METFLFYANITAFYADITLSVLLTLLITWTYYIANKALFSPEIYLVIYKSALKSAKRPFSWCVILPVFAGLTYFGQVYFMATYVVSCIILLAYLKHRSAGAVAAA